MHKIVIIPAGIRGCLASTVVKVPLLSPGRGRWNRTKAKLLWWLTSNEAGLTASALALATGLTENNTRVQLYRYFLWGYVSRSPGLNGAYIYTLRAKGKRFVAAAFELLDFQAVVDEVSAWRERTLAAAPGR